MAVKGGDGGRKRKDAHAVRRTTYKGHELAFSADETTRTVYVDGVAHRYELLPRGYILDAWAYESADRSRRSLSATSTTRSRRRSSPTASRCAAAPTTAT